MYRKLKNLISITVDTEKQSVSMHRKLIVYWIFMVLSVFAALLVILSIAGVFSNAEQMLHRTLSVQQENTVESINEQIESLKARGAALSRQIGDTIDEYYYTDGIYELSDQPQTLLSIQNALYPALSTALWGSPCSGAYYVLDATTNTQAEGAETSRTGMYLRYVNLNVKNSVNPDVVYFRGIPEIARKRRLELHNRWNLEFDTAEIPGYTDMIGKAIDRAADGVLWSGRMCLPETWEEIMLLMFPILDINGTVQGVCGMEISDLYFRLSYPSYDSSFGKLITILAPAEDDMLLLEKGMIGGLEGVYLDDMEPFRIREGKYFNTYIGKYGTFYGLQEKIDMQMADGTSLVAVTMIPSASYQEMANQERWMWIGISVSFFALMLLLSYILSKKFVNPIVDSFSMMQNEDAVKYSGISEVDALMDYINSKKQNQTVGEGSLPPDIAELFEAFSERAKTLTATERKILAFYIDGYEIAQIPEAAFISINTVRKHNANIYQKMGVNSKDELMLYIELFRRCDRLDELYDVQTAQKTVEN